MALSEYLLPGLYHTAPSRAVPHGFYATIPSPRHSRHTASRDAWGNPPLDFSPPYASMGYYDTAETLHPRRKYHGYATEPYYCFPGQYQYPGGTDSVRSRLPSKPPRPRPPPRPRSVRPAASSLSNEPAEDRHIPLGYSYKNWDPSEEPIMLLGSVFNTNSLNWDASPSLRSSKSKGTGRTWRQGDPFPTPAPNTKPQVNRRKVLRTLIKGQEQLCCPDSGSGQNIMSQAFANEQKLPIHRRRKDIKRFQMGCGKYVLSVGRVYVRVQIPGLPLRQSKRSFFVLENCPVQVVLGMPFLQEAEILTKNRHLLEPCPQNWSSISRFLWIGIPRNRMDCSINGHDLVAVADTGSDLNLMSLECARKGGFHIDTRAEVRRRVQVGDSSEVKTVGRVYVYNLEFDWRKPECGPFEGRAVATSATFSSRPETTEGDDSSFQSSEDADDITIFDVIEGLPSDVVFGRDLLEATDAFNHCSDLFSTPRDNKLSAHEFNVFVDRGPILSFKRFRRRKKEDEAVIVETKERHDERRWAEHCRRAQEDDRIKLLPTNEQTRARDKERDRVRAWDEFHLNCEYCSAV